MTCVPQIAGASMRWLSWLMCGGLIMAVSTENSRCAEIVGPAPFGKTAGGEDVAIYTLKSKRGVTARIMTLGGTIVDLHAPDKAGTTANIVLGFNDVAGYQSDANQYFGCTVGR